MSLDLKVVTFPVNPEVMTASYSPFHPEHYNLAFAEGWVMFYAKAHVCTSSVLVITADVRET